MSTDLRAKCAIAGLGQTRMGRNFDHQSATGFAAQAVDLALEDAGLKRTDLDLYQMEIVTLRAGAPFKKVYPLQ